MIMPEAHNPNVTAPLSEQRRYPVVGLELPLTEPEPARWAAVGRAWWERVRISKIGLFVASLYLFVLAVTLMKDGARGIAPLVHNLLDVTSTANALGFGWLFAYAIMSGSPIATAALTFFDAGVVDELGAFAMITGSRLGASFIVLFIGFLFVLRGRDRATSLSIGLLSLVVTATTYLPGFLLGMVVLKTGMLDWIQLRSGGLLLSVVGRVVEPVAGVAVSLLPSWAVFVVGLGVIWFSFNLFDKCLPQTTLKESQVGWMSRLVYRPWVMFALGALITLISMSVSLSLAILVPLSARGYVRRENVIPYIMGANITTFIDTVLAAVLLENPGSFTIVFVQMFSITAVSVVILATSYRRYERGMLSVVAWVTARNRNLAVFMAAIFMVPIALMFV
jgi:sodium-dependent phosphate cotransporter